jgi:hypothetical protein
MEQIPSWEADQFSQLTKKFPSFYGPRRFFTVLTSARHLSLSWANSIQSPRPPPTSSTVSHNWIRLRPIHTYHAVPMPCGSARALDCVFPIWFTQCGRVWFTHTMSFPCHATHIPFWKWPLKATRLRKPLTPLASYTYSKSAEAKEKPRDGRLFDHRLPESYKEADFKVLLNWPFLYSQLFWKILWSANIIHTGMMRLVGHQFDMPGPPLWAATAFQSLFCVLKLVQECVIGW